VLCSFNSANADIIFRHGSAPPLTGVILSTEGNEIQFEEVFLSGESKKRSIFKSDIRQMIRTIDANRLASLSPTDPAGYLEHAEELSGFKQDFLATRLAKRLYVLGAYYSKGETQASCFMALASMAEDSKQKNRIRALAIVSLESNFRRTIQQQIRDEKSAKQQYLDAMLQLLRHLRSQNFDEANNDLKSPSIQACFDTDVQNFLSLQRAKRMIANKKVSTSELLLIAKLELAIVSRESSALTPQNDLSVSASKPISSNLEWVSFSNVTQFDPKHCVYRNGEWVENE